MQHLKSAHIFPQTQAASLSWGRPCGPQRQVPCPRRAALVLGGPQQGGGGQTILGYLLLLMTSLSLQYASMTASLKRASTTWSSICKCQIQGPSPFFHSQHGAYSLLRIRSKPVPTSGHSECTSAGVTSFSATYSLASADVAVHGFSPSLSVTCGGRRLPTVQKAGRLGQWRKDQGEQPFTSLPPEACHAGLGPQLAGVSMRVCK